MTRNLAAALALLAAGCSVGPNYTRPDVDLPKDWGVAQASLPASARWWTLFQDPVLERLVDEALGANRDLKAAAERIEQARAQLAVTRADQLPAIGIEATRSRDHASSRGSFPLPPEFVNTNTHRLVARASWELDFWGKFRRATEAARADLAASEAGGEAIRVTLAADVVRGYFALEALERRSEVALRTLEGRRKSFELQKLRFDSGAVSELELRQVESDRIEAEALAPQIDQARTREEGALALLLGRTPREILSTRVATGTPVTPPAIEVPAGLPSDLLLRRPDLRQAEARLHAANARIGVARAAYFPRISLTGFYGGESQSLGDLFTGPARAWSAGAGLVQPLFAAGQIRGGMQLADARAREAAILYQDAIAKAFREVRDAIAAQSSAREIFTAQQARERALTRTLELERLRFDNGAVSLFELLDTERLLLNVRLEAIDAERNRRDAIVELYLALGA